VRAMWGAYNPATGLIVGAPYVYFTGEIDVPTWNVGDDISGAASFACVSAFETFFEVNQGQRLSHTFLQSISPGDLGMEYVTNVAINYPWGRSGQRPRLVRASQIR